MPFSANIPCADVVCARFLRIAMSSTAAPYFYDPNLRRAIESLLLPDIRTPAQYIGGEVGQVVKRADEVRARMCFCFPDVYSIGMSNVALSVLYDIVNKRADFACERAFCPQPDMEALLRNAG
ncbi:MAG: hypothetical protein HUK22_07055, partial [Thermoguttaceae bacterium]|nr:hypothetical protein [Thermoguttaceae bacterium]